MNVDLSIPSVFTSMNEFTRSFYEVLDIGCPIQQLFVQMVEASEALPINSI